MILSVSCVFGVERGEWIEGAGGNQGEPLRLPPTIHTKRISKGTPFHLRTNSIVPEETRNPLPPNRKYRLIWGGPWEAKEKKGRTAFARQFSG